MRELFGPVAAGNEITLYAQTEHLLIRLTLDAQGAGDPTTAAHAYLASYRFKMIRRAWQHDVKGHGRNARSRTSHRCGQQPRLDMGSACSMTRIDERDGEALDFSQVRFSGSQINQCRAPTDRQLR